MNLVTRFEQIKENEPCVLVHGGAGLHREQTIAVKLPVIKESINAGWDVLLQRGTGEAAVVAALRVLEGSEYFNAGYGAYPNEQGIVLLDVGLMNGAREFVSLMNVRRLKYPSALAYDLLQRGYRSMLIYTHELMRRVDAASPDQQQRYGLVKSNDEMIAPYVQSLLQKSEGELSPEHGKHGTVGCIVRTADGKLYAGTSTGGVGRKINGRVGDSPVIGAGVYADDEIAALSLSGHGEAILGSALSGFLLAEIRRSVRAHSKFASRFSLAALVEDELRDFARRSEGKCAGVIIVTPHGAPYASVSGGAFTIGYRGGNGQPHALVIKDGGEVLADQ